MTTIQTTLSAPKLQLGSFYVHVWGCQMNVYDGGRIRDLMTASGFAESSTPKGANIIILVTCAVRAKAEDKVIFGGRLGMYKYFDMHQVVDEALKCVRKELEIN